MKRQYYFAGGQNPAVGVSLRHMSDNTFSIVLLGRGKAEGGRGTVARRVRAGSSSTPAADHTVIANVDAISAPELVYPEAVYLHNGETYLVRELDLAGKVAYVERRETDYYTQAVLESNVRITGERGGRAKLPRGDARAMATSTWRGRRWRSRRSNSPRAKTSASGR